MYAIEEIEGRKFKVVRDRRVYGYSLPRLEGVVVEFD